MRGANLMHPPMYEAIGEPLNLLSGLDEEAAVRDADGHAPAILKPHRQPWEARLAVDGEEVEVIVVARVAGPCRTVLLKIDTWVAQQQLGSICFPASTSGRMNASHASTPCECTDAGC